MKLKLNWLVGCMLITASVLSSGCATSKPTRVPEFISKLSQQQYSPEQKQVIGEMLRYINDLEYQTATK